jgi:hypothetical protein
VDEPVSETPVKPKKPTEKEYRDAEARLAISYCPTIHPCGECGWPVIYGYCCTHCGSGRP